MSDTSNSIVCSHWGVIKALGPDAAAFLQGQLTADVAALDAGRAMLAGYCSAKGRLLASFVVVRPSEQEFVLVGSQDLLGATLKRLSMFVLRARCVLSDAGAELPIIGTTGPDVPAALSPRRAMEVHDGWVRWPDDQGRPRAWRFDAGGAGRPAGADSARLAWHDADLRGGLPTVVAATVDQFVPQMVNLELVGGVSFSKGCYPGQEVVARSQYRGTTKRRMYLFEGAAPASPGAEVFHASDPSQPAGTVVDAVSLAGCTRLLASVKTAAVDADPDGFRLAQAEGPALRHLALPYAIPRESDGR